MLVILYSTHCPKCEILEKKLNSKNIDFETCTDTKIMTDKGFTTVPKLEVNGTTMDFAEANKWVNEQR